MTSTFLRIVMLLATIFSFVSAMPRPRHADPPIPPAPAVALAFSPEVQTPPSAFNASIHSAPFSLSQRAPQPQLWITYYTVPPVCHDGVCTVTSTDDLPHIKANGQSFTLGGNVWIGIYRTSDVAQLYGAHTIAGHWTGYIDGSWGYNTGLIDCGTTHPANAFMAAYDYTTKIWSNYLYLYRGCAIL